MWWDALSVFHFSPVLKRNCHAQIPSFSSSFFFYRELVMGVETLKNVAEVLTFIDRITEIKHA